jgi:hypothetical protein
MTAKMQGPANHGGISHDGTSYEPDEKGQIDVPEHVVAYAFDHGFTLVAEQTAPADQQGKESAGPLDLTKLKKADLIAYAKDTLGVDLDPAMTNKDLVAEIEAALAAKATQAAPADQQGKEAGAE